MPLDPQRRSALLQAKARALVRDQFGEADRVASTFPGGASLIEAGTGWVLVEESAARSLGAVISWAKHNQLDDTHLLAEDGSEVLARRAQQFTRPPHIWCVDGRRLCPAQPAAPPVDVPLPPSMQQLAELLREADLEVVLEHGVLTGEVRGLEVARAVEDADGGVHLEVGVGRFDREAGAILHADLPRIDALRAAAELVRRHRQAGSSDHPISRLAPERWLRSVIIEQPGLVGAAELEAVATTLTRRNLREPHPAAAVGTTGGGERVIVLCSVGVDLDLVPAAADVRAARDPRARLVLALPERDMHPALLALAAELKDPPQLVGLDASWRD